MQRYYSAKSGLFHQNIKSRIIDMIVKVFDKVNETKILNLLNLINIIQKIINKLFNLR